MAHLIVADVTQFLIEHIDDVAAMREHMAMRRDHETLVAVAFIDELLASYIAADAAVAGTLYRASRP